MAREVAANERKLLDSIVECYTVSLLDEWARQIWHEIHTGDLEFYNGGEDWLYARADSFKKDAFQVEKGAARA